jgi:NADH:ubiquinone reductase (H+-translocating)
VPLEVNRKGRRRVVIVGGGFGGAAAARALRRADLDVTLVDRRNHHLFQPLLYQVAAGGLSEGECAATIRTMLRKQANATVLMATVAAVDADARAVTLDSGERLEYDSLILAAGAETSYFGRDEWAESAPGLKTLADAIELRDRIFGAFEQAERAVDSRAREEWLSFVVVGGGPTGVEVSGQLAILAHHTLEKEFRRIDTRQAKVTLIDAGERLVPSFGEKLSEKTAAGLTSLGVSVREGARATAIDDAGIEVKVGDATERIPARTIIWAAGVRAVGLAGVVAAATGAEVDRSGRVEVGTDCTLPGHPEISVVGDMGSHPGPGDRPLPGLATVAIQQARHVAKGIAGGGVGASTPFHYLDKGALAVVGRGMAVCEVRGRQLSGRPAFFMYLGVHLYYLSGVFGHRVAVLRSWLQSRFGVRDEQVIVAGLPPER